MRLGPRVALVSVLLACTERPAPGAAPGTAELDAPTGDATPSATADERGSSVVSDRGSHPGSGHRSSSVAIGVTSVEPSDARPCEQLCGRVGDCLSETGDRADVASRQELECLDACVNSPPQSPPHREFLACDTAQTCPSLTECVTQRWDALLATRVTPVPETVVKPSVDCALACEWLISCVVLKTRPDARSDNPSYDVYIDSCTENCTADPAAQADFFKLQECLMVSCHDPIRCDL